MRRGAAIVLLAFLLASCGGNDASEVSGDAADVVVDAHEYAFEPDAITVAEGDVMALSNSGMIVHDLVVENTDVAMTAAPKETTSGTVDLAPGTYTFFCSVPGHRDSGMEGTLVIEE